MSNTNTNKFRDGGWGLWNQVFMFLFTYEIDLKLTNHNVYYTRSKIHVYVLYRLQHWT